MNVELDIEILKDIPDLQKLSEGYIEKNITNSKEVEKLFLRYKFQFHNNCLVNLNDKIQLETFSSANPKNVSKEIMINPGTMFYYINDSLEKSCLILKNKSSNSIKRSIFPTKINFLNYCVNLFYVVGWGKRLFLCHIQNGFMYLMNFDLIILKIINIKKIKKISYRKKADIILQYEEKKQNKIMNLLSSYNRAYFVGEIVQNNCGILLEEKENEFLLISKYEREYQKRKLLSILSDSENDSQKFEIIKKMKDILKLEIPNSYYKYELTYLNRKLKFSNLINIDLSNFEMKSRKINLMLLFYNYSLVSQVFSLINFGLNHLPMDFSKDKSYQQFLKIITFIRRQDSKKEIEEKQKKIEDEELKGIRNRPRKEVEKKRKKNINGKCVYKNIRFRYCSSKSGSFQKDSKDIKEIELSTGCLKYQKDKNEITINIKQIDRLISKNECNRYLMISFYIESDKKETIELFFINAYEKYLFQTLIYNFIIFTIPRNIQDNQLTINCNIMTWNVAGIDVPNDLIPLFNSKSLDKVDILAIGVQECGLFKIKDWMKHLKRLINYYGFKDVETTSMFQMFLLVFVKQELYPLIDDVSVETKAMGFAKLIGNKGGMVISFKISGYRFSIINCHLAPKPHKVLERNKHAKTLVKQVKVGDGICEFDTESDYVFWMGDMNYRVDYIFQEVLEEISKNNLQLLLSKDQLIRQKQQNQIFTDYQEAEINFWPTYRRVKGTDEYSNKKNQSPSWCDRVLVKSERFIDIMFYDSIQEVNLSDHLPVLSKFSLYLTTPSVEDIDKILQQKIVGTFCFSDIQVKYNFTEGLSEIETKLSLPAKVKLSIHYFINNTKTESKELVLKDYESFEILEFEDLYVQCPPQFLFDLPHAKSMSFYWVLTIFISNEPYEIGYSKFCLENIENLELNLLSYSYEMNINFRTRNLGTILFNSTYKM